MGENSFSDVFIQIRKLIKANKSGIERETKNIL